MPQQPKFEHRGWTRWLVRWFVAIYYPHIEIDGTENISPTGPVLLCANHGNSLVDPVVIGIAARRPVRFMAKAPLFEHPILGPPMSALGMVPAFRGSDDAKQVRRNLESLDVGAKVLVDGHAMGIFPEGKSTDQAHLEMIRSGAARMAIQAVEEGAKELQVVPIGITYERKEQFRSAVLVRIGPPIDVAALLREHEGDERRARRALTSELESRLRGVVVHLDQPDWEPWLDDLEVLLPAADAGGRAARPLWQRKRIADAINYFHAHDRPRAESIADAVRAYRDDAQAAGLRVDSPILVMSSIQALLRLAMDVCLLVFFFLPALLGTLQHFLPFVVVRNIASRMDQPGRLTISTHRLLVGVPIYLLWYAVVAVLMMLYSPVIAIAWLIAAPFCGLVAVHYWRRAGRMVSLAYHDIRLLLGQIQLRELRRQRQELGQMLDKAANAYAGASPTTS